MSDYNGKTVPIWSSETITPGPSPDSIRSFYLQEEKSGDKLVNIEGHVEFS